MKKELLHIQTKKTLYLKQLLDLQGNPRLEYP
jgi:hypothetical protein